MESSGIQVILPNMIEFIPMLIAFIIVAIVLWKFGWPKFEGMLEKRKNTIEDALKQSEENKVQSEKLLEEYNQKLVLAEKQADDIIQDAKQTGVQLGKNIEDAAKKQADMVAQKAQSAIEQKKKTAEYEIKEQAVDIALFAVKKFVSSDLTDEQHRKLIEKYVKEAGSLRA